MIRKLSQICLILLLGAPASYANEFKNIWLKKPSNRCNIAFSPNSITFHQNQREKHRIEKLLPQRLNRRMSKSFKLNKISDYEQYIHSLHTEIENYLIRLQSGNDISLAAEKMYEVFRSRFQKMEAELVEKLTAVKLEAPQYSFEQGFVPLLENRNRNKVERRVFGAFESHRMLLLGAFGELGRGTREAQPEALEIYVENLLNHKQREYLEKKGVLESFEKYEIDLVAGNNTKWVEVKYLSLGYGEQAHFVNPLMKKLENINRALELLENAGLRKGIYLELYVSGPGRLSPSAAKKIKKTMPFIKLRMYRTDLGSHL